MFELTLASILTAISLIAAPPSHATVYDEFFATVDYMAKKYGMGMVFVSQQVMDPDTYAMTEGTSIWFNTLYLNDPDELYASMRSDVQHDFHPGWNCSAAQILGVHESAHVLDTLTGRSAWTEVRATYGDQVTSLYGQLSGYSFQDGWLDISEALADAMVAVECDVPTPAESALYYMLTT